MMVKTAYGSVGIETAGDGIPVVLLHGFPHNRTLWSPQLDFPMSGIYRLTPDLPGFGESSAIEEPSVESWSDWLVALLDTMELDKVVLGGLSMGGYVTLAFWRRYPERVRGLILADTKSGADSAEGKKKRLEMQELVAANGSGAVADQMITGMVGKTTREQRPAVVATLDAMMRKASPKGVHDALDVMRNRPDSTPFLPRITVPTLIICGDEDVLTPPDESRAMARDIPDSHLEIVPKAGHASNLEAPDTFSGLLMAFVQAKIL